MVISINPSVIGLFLFFIAPTFSGTQLNVKLIHIKETSRTIKPCVKGLVNLVWATWKPLLASLPCTLSGHCSKMTSGT